MAEFQDNNFQRILDSFHKLAVSAAKRGDTQALKDIIQIAYLNGQAKGLLHAMHDELDAKQMVDRAEALMSEAGKITREKL